jgi:4-amino-4-deoxy-L-arabinose transferase-like glycosyltransferase
VLAVAGIAALCACLYLPGLGALPFYDKGEPREALWTLEQQRSGDWVLPRLGRTLPSKPPLFRWAAGVTAAVHGRVDELAMRLPSALFAMATVLALLAWATRRFGAPAGPLAALVLVTSWQWITAAREARVDMTLAACLTVACLALERALRERPTWRTLAAFWLATALAVLAKGPVGAVLPALVAAVYLGICRDPRRAWTLRPVAGTLVVLAVAGSWYALAAHAGGEAFVRRHLVAENLARFAGREGGQTSHGHPFWYYGPAFLAGFAPWTLYLPAVAVWLWRRRGTLEARSVLFPLVWLAVVIGFYSLSAGKRGVYILPAYPAAAVLLAACVAEPVPRTAPSRRVLAASAVAGGAVVAVAVAVAAAAVAGAALGHDPLALVARALHARDRENLDLVRGVLATAAPALLAALAVATAAGVAALRAAGRGARVRAAAGVAAVALALVAVAVHVVEPALAARRTLRPFAARVRGLVPDGDALAFYAVEDFGMFFYAGRPIGVLGGRLPDAASGKRVHVLVWEDEWQRLGPRQRGRLVPVATSDGIGPARDGRLMLMRLLPPDSGSTRGPGAGQGPPMRPRRRAFTLRSSALRYARAPLVGCA